MSQYIIEHNVCKNTTLCLYHVDITCSPYFKNYYYLLLNIIITIYYYY